jgi:hypothetical protein
MRRSFAPSQQKSTASPQAPIKQSNQVKSVPSPTASRNENIYQSATKFNVVYGNVSGRKHKVYDNDGILEMRGKKAVLKDVNGKVMHVFDLYVS